MPNAKLIYSTSLPESRQIFAVSKTINFSELSVANENLLLSLKNIERQNYLEDFDEYRFYIDTEIHLSSIRMPFRNCQRHCLRGGARMIDTPTAFLGLLTHFRQILSGSTRMSMHPPMTIRLTIRYTWDQFRYILKMTCA